VFREVHEFTKTLQLRKGELLTFEGLMFGARIALIKEEVRDLLRRAGAFPENEAPAIRDLHGD
jgi:hypothetical protein